jgi:DNA-binding CsgD family transcriptional regulator
MLNEFSLESQLLKAVEAIYDAAPHPLHWPRALQAIADCFGDVGALLLCRRDDGSYGTIVSDSLAAAQKDYETNGWMTRDLLAIRGTERGYFFNGEPFTTHQLVSEEEIHSDPIFVQFRARHNLGGVGCVAVSPAPHIGVVLAMQRHADQREYSESELKMLGRIGRHIEKALRLSIRLLDAELANLGLAEALARIGIGVFALDSLGRVVFSNPTGQRLIGDRLYLERGRLRIGLGKVRQTIDDAIRDTIRADSSALIADPKPILVHSPEAERPFVVYILPVISAKDLGQKFLVQTRAIVLVIEQKVDEPADPAVVRDILGLTLGESRVAALVGVGVSPKDAAERLGIAEETARNLLKRVFAKVGVSRQPELVALLGKLVLR